MICLPAAPRVAKFLPVLLTLLVVAHAAAQAPPVKQRPSQPVSAGNVPVQSDCAAPHEILAAAGTRTAWFVLRRTHDAGPAFQIFAHELPEGQVRSSTIYLGSPQCALARENRLVLFFSDGAARSYGSDFVSHAAPRLPEGLELLAATAREATIYALARTIAAVSFPGHPGRAPATNGDANTPQVPGAVDLEPGAVILLAQTTGGEWRLFAPEPLGVDPACPSLTAVNGDVHVFALAADSAGQDEASGRQLTHWRFANGRLAARDVYPEPAGLPVAALAVNRQARLVLAQAVPEAQGPDSGPAAVYRLATVTPAGLREGGLLSGPADQPLGAAPAQLAIFAHEQNLHAFELVSETQVIAHAFLSSGEPLRQQALALDDRGERLPDWVARYLRPAILFAAVAISVLVLYLRRDQAMAAPRPLPAGVLPAPYLRRIVAFLLDFLATILLFMPLALWLFPELVEQYRTAEPLSWPQLRDTLQQTDALLFSLLYWPVLIAYRTFFESLLSATPGKLAMRLIVLAEDARPLPLGAAFVRNAMLLVEFPLEILVLLVMIITVRRQRVGDLAARTIVFLRNDALEENLRTLRVEKTPQELDENSPRDPEDQQNPPR